MVEELKQELIEQWVRMTTGIFTLASIRREHGIETRKSKATLRKAMERLVEKGIVRRITDKDGTFVLVDINCPVIEWETANTDNIFPLIFPKGFGFENLITIFPKNIIVIAGSPNCGKTGFLLNVVANNMHFFPVDYYSSEMGATELKDRLTKFEDITEWKFQARERSLNFGEVIHPDHISIIDYLEVTKDFYAVADELNGIHSKLKDGIALVALQKKRGASLGRGAEFSLERPRLYLSMDNNKLTIEKAKNWRDHTVNPNGLSWSFKLVKGCLFTNINRVISYGGIQ